jgi:hypothetical protein
MKTPLMVVLATAMLAAVALAETINFDNFKTGEPRTVAPN